MIKITPEMRLDLRKPLPEEAVTQHPTKTYLSSIKGIYVVERINDVFGLGTWTLKGDFIERLGKFVVVKVVLQIPEYGFYGEAYGGNDNADPGDAYKGAVTDGFTKIAAQQLEIGIDVYKGLSDRPATSESKAKPTTQGEAGKTDHWCSTHGTNFFKTDKMVAYAHPIKGTARWCYEKVKVKDAAPTTKQKEEIEELWKEEESAQEPLESTRSPSKEQTGIIDLDWLNKSLDTFRLAGVTAWEEDKLIKYINTMLPEAKTSLKEAVKSLEEVSPARARQLVETAEQRLKELKDSKGTS